LGEKPREELQVSPEWSTIIFGDGYAGSMRGAIEKIIDGRRIIVLTLKPGDMLKKRYNIKDSEMTADGKMQYQIDEINLIPLNLYDDANRTFIYLKNYNHEETNISQITWKFEKIIKELSRRVVVVEGTNLFLSEQLQLAKTAPMEFAAQSLEIFERITASTIDALKFKKEKEGE